MRIGIELKHLDPLRGGAEAYTFRFANWLSDAGHEVHLFVNDSPASMNGVVIHRLSPFSPSRIRSATESARLDVFIGTDKAVTMDLFHPHRGTVRGNVAQEIARIRNRLLRGTALAANRMNPRYLRARILERRQVNPGNEGPLVIAVSEMIAGEIRADFGLEADRLTVVHNGVDCSWFSDEYCRQHRTDARRHFGIAEGEVCYLLVANDFARKGVSQFIRASSLLLQQHCDIFPVVVGRSDPRPYERLTARLGCSGRIHFFPTMGDIRTAYAAADVFVLPTWYDPCSLTLLEAWACGIPVITTIYNGASELMNDGQEGYRLTSPGDVRSLADRMHLLLDSEPRLTMGRQGRLLAERNPLEKNFRQLEEILHQRKRISLKDRR